MSIVAFARKLWDKVVSNWGAEECSVLLALVVIVGLTAMSTMGSLSAGQAKNASESSWPERPLPPE